MKKIKKARATSGHVVLAFLIGWGTESSWESTSHTEVRDQEWVTAKSIHSKGKVNNRLWEGQSSLLTPPPFLANTMTTQRYQRLVVSVACSIPALDNYPENFFQPIHVQLALVYLKISHFLLG